MVKDYTDYMSAFPDGNGSTDGMDLRDWFAGQALVGWFATNNVFPRNFAARAYELADAMMKQRRFVEDT